MQPFTGLWGTVGNILVLQVWKPYGLGRNVWTGLDNNICRHTTDTRIELMDSTVPMEVMVGGAAHPR